MGCKGFSSIDLEQWSRKQQSEERTEMCADHTTPRYTLNLTSQHVYPASFLPPSKLPR